MERVLVMRKCKGYKKLLVGDGSPVRLDKVSVQDAYEDALESHTDLDKKDWRAQ